MSIKFLAIEILPILLSCIVVASAFADGSGNDFSATSLVSEAEQLFPTLAPKYQGSYQIGLLADLHDRLGNADQSKKYYDLLVERASGDRRTAINGTYPSAYCETLIRFHSRRKQFSKAREFVEKLEYESQNTFLESYILCGEAMTGDWQAALNSVDARTYEDDFTKEEALQQILVAVSYTHLKLPTIHSV